MADDNFLAAWVDWDVLGADQVLQPLGKKGLMQLYFCSETVVTKMTYKWIRKEKTCSQTVWGLNLYSSAS
jgi:hypothetical protein